MSSFLGSPMAGALLGLLGGGGVALAVTRLPAFRRPTLDDRLAPYLSDKPRPSRLLTQPRTVTPFPTLERILRPVLADGAQALERILGGSGSVRRRLEQVGSDLTVEQFRVEQLIWGAAGLLAGVGVSLLRTATGAGSLALLVLCVMCGASGVLLRDRWLTRAVTLREQHMLTEFPTIAEMVALAVAAGEGAVGALERVTRASRGELSRELARVLAEVRAGTPFAEALGRLAERTSLPILARFADGVAVAVERGTPLAEVLRAQAADVREVSKRALLEAGGRKEIAMMVPVIFLILPVTIVFALFPGFYGLDITTP